MQKFAIWFLLVSGTSSGGVITFDDLPVASGGADLPTSYAGLNWNDWGYTSAPFGGSNGYATDLISSPNVAFNLGANSPENFAIITSATPFIPLNGYFAAAFDDDLTITVSATLFGNPVGSVNFVVNETASLFETFSFGPVTELDFSVSGGTPHPGVNGTGPYFALDNFSIAPEPASLALIPFGLLILASFKRRDKLKRKEATKN